MVNPKSLANLKPFLPGNKAASGEGKQVSLTAALKRYLRANPKKLNALAEACIEFALDGNAAYAREVWERLDGKLKDTHEGTITVTVKWDGNGPVDRACGPVSGPATKQGGS